MESLDILIGFSVVMLVVAQASTLFIDFIGQKKLFGFRKKEFDLFASSLKASFEKVVYEQKVESSQSELMRQQLNHAINSAKDNVQIEPLIDVLITDIPDMKQSKFLEASLFNEFSSDEFESSERYKLKCALISTAFAFMLSVFLNINAITIFKTLSTDVTAREALIANQASTINSLQIANLSEIQQLNLEGKIDELKGSFSELQQHKSFGIKSPGEQKWDELEEEDFWGFLLTALFAGFGAPFWKKVLNELLGLRRVLRGDTKRLSVAYQDKAQTSLPGVKAKAVNSERGDKENPTVLVYLRAGSNGQFKVNVISFDASEGRLNVGIKAEGDVEKVWRIDELKNAIRQQYEIHGPKVNSIVINQQDLIELERLTSS